jgi:hypothetical protein
MCASRIATPEKSSVDPRPGSPPAAASAHAPGTVLGRGGQVALLALNTLPLVHAASVVVLLALPPWSWAARLAAATAALWLAPPLLCRGLLALSPLPDGTHAMGSRAFWIWWTTLKLQTLYLRLPFTEEILRLVPGLYSTWLRLWGARIGRFTYWSPGLEITDRPLLDIGDRVVLGGKARLGAHLFRRRADGALELLVGRIAIGHRCMIGAQSAIGPGVRLADDEFTHAFFLGAPFTHWRGGRRIKDESSPSSPTTHES